MSLIEATLQDGQRMLAFNDLFIGPETHVSARYRITYRGNAEDQSSSGILVSTGAGSTGWLSSIFNMARGVSQLQTGAPAVSPMKLPWDTRRFPFVVREPFQSLTSGTDLGVGWIEPGHPISVESHMPAGGVIFSDGIPSDFMAFNSGAIAHIGMADQQAQLVSAA